MVIQLGIHSGLPSRFAADRIVGNYRLTRWCARFSAAPFPPVNPAEFLVFSLKTGYIDEFRYET